MEIYDGKGHNLMTDLLHQDNPVAQRVLGYADSLSRGLKDGKLTALSPVDQENSIKIYPNPASGHLLVSFGEHTYDSIELVLMSMEGKEYRLMHEHKTSSSSKVEVGGCPAGVYVLSVQAGKHKFRQKILIH